MTFVFFRMCLYLVQRLIGAHGQAQGSMLTKNYDTGDEHQDVPQIEQVLCDNLT